MLATPLTGPIIASLELEYVAEYKSLYIYIILLEESSIKYQSLQSVTHFHQGINGEALEIQLISRYMLLSKIYRAL